MSLGKQLHRLNVWETIEGSFKVGLSGIHGVITPISRIISPTLPIDFQPFIRVISPLIHNWARGPTYYCHYVRTNTEVVGAPAIATLPLAFAYLGFWIGLIVS